MRRAPITLASALLATISAGGLLATATASPALAASPAPAATPTAANTTNDSCHAPLPAAVNGAPANFHAGELGGAYLWHTTKGWRLRVTHRGHGKVVFTGTIHSQQPISYQGYRLERSDSVTLSGNRRTLSFRFVDYGGVDGIDFVDNCSRNTVAGFARDGHRLPATRVFLGARGAHPTSDPFDLQRS